LQKAAFIPAATDVKALVKDLIDPSYSQRLAATN